MDEDRIFMPSKADLAEHPQPVGLSVDDADQITAFLAKSWFDNRAQQKGWVFSAAETWQLPQQAIVTENLQRVDDVIPPSVGDCGVPHHQLIIGWLTPTLPRTTKREKQEFAQVFEHINAGASSRLLVAANRVA